MEALYTCIAQEFRDCPFTSVQIRPTYSVIKGKNVVTLTIDIFNKYHNCLKRQIYKFVNDRYHPTVKNPLQNISPEQLDQAFKIAKMDLLTEIYNKDITKYNTYTNKLNELQAYATSDCNPEINNDAPPQLPDEFTFE